MCPDVPGMLEDVCIPSEINGKKVNAIIALYSKLRCKSLRFESKMKVCGDFLSQIIAEGTVDLRNADFSYEHKQKMQLNVIAKKLLLPENQSINRPVRAELTCSTIIFPGSLSVRNNRKCSDKKFGIYIKCKKLVFKKGFSLSMPNCDYTGTIENIIYEKGTKHIYGHFSKIKINKVNIPTSVVRIGAGAFCNAGLKVWPRINFKKIHYVSPGAFSGNYFYGETIDLTGLKIIPADFLSTFYCNNPDNKPSIIILDKNVKGIALKAFYVDNLSGNSVVSKYIFRNLEFKNTLINKFAFNHCEIDNLSMTDCLFENNCFHLCSIQKLSVSSQLITPGEKNCLNFVFFTCNIHTAQFKKNLYPNMFNGCNFDIVNFDEAEKIGCNSFVNCNFNCSVTLKNVTVIEALAFCCSEFSFCLQFFSTSDGLVNQALMGLGLIDKPLHFLSSPNYFWGLAVGTGIWKEMGWWAIIFLAAITSVDPTMYEAAMIDGAGRLKRIRHITLPSIAPTITVVLI